MKKLVLILLVCLLLYGITQPVTAQGPVIYLPVIVKGSETMTTWAKLEISDGTTTVNLIAGGATGFHLKDWNPQIIQPKEGGVFQDSPIAPGRRLVYAVDATAVETMTIDVNDYDEDGLIEQAQDLMRLLNKARAYGGTTDYQDTPVYIRGRSDCETNDRYAVIINWAIPELDNPYAPPFVSAGEIALMDDLTLQLERGHWTANAPGVGTCVEASSQQVWDYDLAFESVHNDAVSTTFPEFARHVATGDLYAVADTRLIVKSTDDGATWANNLTGAPLGVGWQGRHILTLANDTLIALGYTTVTGTGAVVRSVDNGANWTDESEADMSSMYHGVQSSAGTVLAVGSDGSANFAIWRSTDNGATFTKVFASSLSTGASRIAQATNGDIVVLAQSRLNAYRNQIYRSTNDGANWSLLGDFASGGIPMEILLASDGNLYLLPNSYTGPIHKSTTNGASWVPLAYTPNSAFTGIIETSTAGEFYAVAQKNSSGQKATELWQSTDYGLTWQLLGQISARSASSAEIGLYQNTDNRLFVGTRRDGVGADIYRSSEPATVTMGRGATCTAEVMIVNNYHQANITHIFRDDGGVFTSIFPAALPATLFPAVPANNDALYIGVQSSILQSGPFNNITFDLSTVMAGIYTLTWEYWTGAAWATLTTTDNTASLSNPGVHSVHWTPPSNWATTAVNGVTAWWVRARVSAITGAVTPPVQQNRNIYSVVTNYIDIDEAQVAGDIPAISQIKSVNLSDLDGPGGNAPNLYANRIVAGLRSVSRGDFVSIFNIADEQHQPGIAVSVGTTTTFDDDILAPTGRRATFAPAGIEAMITRATISISSSVAANYYGTYHAFLRAQRTAGASTDLTVRLQVATGSGGITYTTTNQQLQTTTAFEVLDFGEITLPVSSSFKSTDLADTTEIRIQASAASGTPDLYLYDLILIPVDEWAVDAVDMANESDSDVGRSNGIAKLLDIDSVTDPRIDIKTLVRTADASEFITAEYNPITGGGAILQANADQRLWFFAMQTSATGATYYWIAPPEIVHSVQVWANPRYLGLRGSR